MEWGRRRTSDGGGRRRRSYPGRRRRPWPWWRWWQLGLGSTLTAALLYGPGERGWGARAWAELAAQAQVAACPTRRLRRLLRGPAVLVRARRRSSLFLFYFEFVNSSSISS